MKSSSSFPISWEAIIYFNTVFALHSILQLSQTTKTFYICNFLSRAGFVRKPCVLCAGLALIVQFLWQKHFSLKQKTSSESKLSFLDLLE